MKNVLAAIALAIGFATSLSAQESPKPPMPEWMAGAWQREDGAKWADEYWTAPRADIMIGASRSGTGDRLTFWEHMRIVREANGALAFWAIAGDQKPVRFGAIRSGENEIIFENPAHDYPQRIRYWREGKVLKAEISSLDGSKAGQFRFDPMGESGPAQ